MDLVDKVVVYCGKTADNVTTKVGEFAGNESIFSFDCDEYINLHVIWTSSDWSDNITVKYDGAAEELEGSGTVVDGYKLFKFRLSGEATFTVKSWTCVAKDTAVAMADGDYKKIQDVIPGDLVYSVDESLQVTVGKVFRTVTGKTSDLVTMTLSDGSSIGMTTTHPVLTSSGYKTYDGYKDKPESKLQIGDKVMCSNGLLEVTDLAYVDYGEVFDVYSLLVIPQDAEYPETDDTVDLNDAADIDAKLYTNWLPWFAGASTFAIVVPSHSGGAGN